MRFRADAPGVDENPLRGLMPWFAGAKIADPFPHSMEFLFLPLSDVVKGRDRYDWASLEQALTTISGNGDQAVVRFYVDNPKSASGIPSYLLYTGLKTFKYDDSDNLKGAIRSVSPDYSDPHLIECLLHFIRAFGVKYDGDARIAYVQAGLYGFWGEWHVHDHPLWGEPSGWAMPQVEKDALLRAYVQSFNKTLVGVRTATVTENHELLAHFGFHDDSFLWDSIGTGDRFFWTGVQKAAVTDSWQQSPTGGEIYPPMQKDLWDAWPNVRGQDWTNAVQTTHATYMLDAALFTHPTSVSAQKNALGAQRMLGYKLFCASSKMVRNKDGSATVTVRIENRGVAPIYYAWPVEVESTDRAMRVVGRGRATWPLPTLLPGKVAEWSVTLNSDSDHGTRVFLRIANPMSGGHNVAFTNAEMGTERRGWLTLDIDHLGSGTAPR